MSHGAVSAPAAEVEGVDGRNERRLRNRTAVLDALVEMFADGHPSPSMDEVAVRSGVSVRSVYRYFETRDSLIRAALERCIAEAGPRLTQTAVIDGDLVTRIEHFSRQRVALYFEFAPLARIAIALGRTDPFVRDIFEFGRDSLRQQFVDLFDNELRRFEARERTLVVVGATAPLQFHAFEYLRSVCEFDAEQMQALVAEQLLLHLSE